MTDLHGQVFMVETLADVARLEKLLNRNYINREIPRLRLDRLDYAVKVYSEDFVVLEFSGDLYMAQLYNEFFNILKSMLEIEYSHIVITYNSTWVEEVS